MATKAIKVTGLAEFNRKLRKLDNDLPKMLRVGLNEAANIVVADAKPHVPRRSGRAAKSVKAQSTRTAARVVGGSKRVPYYPWLDFGGTVGKAKSIKRPFIKRGRYIYQSYFRKRGEFVDVLTDELVKVAKAAGLEVTDV